MPTTTLTLAYQFRTALALLALSAFGAVLALRVRTERRRRLAAAIQARSETTLSLWLDDKAAPLPAKGRTAVLEFCRAWIYHVELVQGELQQTLVRHAIAAGLPGHLTALLERGSVPERVLALRAARSLPDAGLAQYVEPLLSGPDSLALPAAEALVAIDPGAARGAVLPLLLTRQTWPEKRVVALYAGLVRDDITVADLITEHALQGEAWTQVRVARFLGKLSCAERLSRLWVLLDKATDDSVISACLDGLHEPGTAHWARHYLGHARWHVRVHAVRALGRVGSAGDETALIARMSDAQWWVRYRAAQALLQLPLLREPAVAEIYERLEDRFARDILRHAAAEARHGWAQEKDAKNG